MADVMSLLSRRSDGDTQLPERRVGRFVITRELGAGAMGTVYEAHDPDLNRKIALKILRDPDQKDSLRLLREAQTLAQLQHPNVVVIHDVGVMQDGVFIAMELVDGENLREHLADRSLSWERALGLYLQAGRGLVAAHEKSIVHRDFKPANVLIDRHGRVRVTDFGLARLVVEAAAVDERPPATTSVASNAESTVPDRAITIEDTGSVMPTPPGVGGLLGAPLTHEGAFCGTPRYMAPEQHARRPATARSDQYSFCVCLWEAVFGVHPFPHGRGADTVPFGSRRRAPRWLVRALMRGLAFEPGHRHPTMASLLDALERAPRIRRRAWIAAAGLAVLIGGSLVIMGARSSSDPCTDMAPLEAWTDEARVAVRDAFLATSLPFAGRVHDTVARRLDDYATRWRAMKVETCRATRVDGTQAKELFERRNLCLDRRQDEVGALVAALRVIPRDRVEKAIAAMGTLGDLRACSDTVALSRDVPLPQDPARAEQARELEREIADVQAQHSIGRPADRSAKVEDLLARARALEYPPVLVTALGLKVDLEWDSDRWPEVVKLAHEQLVVAEAAGDDRARFGIYTLLLKVNSTRLQRYDEAAQAGRLAEALLQRFGDDPDLAAKLHCSQCDAEWYRGNYEEALRLVKTCVAERERVVPRDEGQLGTSLQRQSIIESSLKRHDEALLTSKRAVELMQRAYGERHPDLALALNAQGVIHRDLGRDDIAEALYRRAISILEESRGETLDLCSVFQNLANLLQEQRKYAEAIALYRRILAILERTLGPQNNRVANTLDMLGKALAYTGQFAEGEAMGLRSIAIREANGSGAHPAQAVAWRILGGQYRRGKRHDKASEAYARSLHILEGKYGKRHPLLVTSLLGIAEAELDAGRPALAMPMLERALLHLEAPEVRPERARLRFLFARALWVTSPDRARARTLVDAAVEIARADENAELVSQIEAWRKTHAGR